MPTCQGKTQDGRSCSRSVKDGALYCWQHEPDEPTARLVDDDGNPRPEVYELLARATPEEKTDIVLRLIEEHPQGKLELPVRNEVFADLRGINLSSDVLRAKVAQSRLKSPPWWDAGRKSANLQFANLQGAFLWDVNLQGVFLGNAILQNARLVNADLENADLNGTNFQGAILTSVNLQGAYLWGTNLQGAHLDYANLQHADVAVADFRRASFRYARLREVDLFTCDIAHIYIGGAWLDRTRLRWDQLGGAIGEELTGEFGAARQGYLALKQNFDDLGDYDAASWAYRKERRMEKLEARQETREALNKRKWRAAVTNCAKFAGDQLVELVCDYGEGTWRVVGSLTAVWIGFTLIYGLSAGVWGPWQDTGSGQIRYVTRNPIDLLFFSLAAMVTHEVPGLEARSTLLMRVLVPLEALLGIFLAGLLGFVVANRIRRS